MATPSRASHIGPYDLTDAEEAQVSAAAAILEIDTRSLFAAVEFLKAARNTSKEDGAGAQNERCRSWNDGQDGSMEHNRHHDNLYRQSDSRHDRYDQNDVGIAQRWCEQKFPAGMFWKEFESDLTQQNQRNQAPSCQHTFPSVFGTDLAQADLIRPTQYPDWGVHDGLLDLEQRSTYGQPHPEVAPHSNDQNMNFSTAGNYHLVSPHDLEQRPWSHQADDLSRGNIANERGELIGPNLGVYNHQNAPLTPITMLPPNPHDYGFVLAPTATSGTDTAVASAEEIMGDSLASAVAGTMQSLPAMDLEFGTNTIQPSLSLLRSGPANDIQLPTNNGFSTPQTQATPSSKQSSRRRSNEPTRVLNKAQKPRPHMARAVTGQRRRHFKTQALREETARTRRYRACHNCADPKAKARVSLQYHLAIAAHI
jgi:hypothetical protein